MKMKMFTMLCALSLGTTAAFAQKGVEDGLTTLQMHTSLGWLYLQKHL